LKQTIIVPKLFKIAKLRYLTMQNISLIQNYNFK